jgi:hypothetical protein
MLGDRVQLQQVMNLILNTIDSMKRPKRARALPHVAADEHRGDHLRH